MVRSCYPSLLSVRLYEGDVLTYLAITVAVGVRAGALYALMLPFVKYGPEVSFKMPIDSIAVSGHKFLGCPMPCGVIVTRKRHVDKLARNIEYLNSKDTTIMGSRNGQAPLFLWYTLRKRGVRYLLEDVKKCHERARYVRFGSGGEGSLSRRQQQGRH